METLASPSVLRAASCWFSVDRVWGDAASTVWKRRARWRQAQWREARQHPMGAQPYSGGARTTRVGSRLELAFARSSGANFITGEALVRGAQADCNATSDFSSGCALAEPFLEDYGVFS